MPAGSCIHMWKPLPEAVESYRLKLHTWPGLTVTEGEGKIIVTMEQKLSIYIRKEWCGWPIEVIIKSL